MSVHSKSRLRGVLQVRSCVRTRERIRLPQSDALVFATCGQPSSRWAFCEGVYVVIVLLVVVLFVAVDMADFAAIGRDTRAPLGVRRKRARLETVAMVRQARQRFARLGRIQPEPEYVIVESITNVR